MTTTEPMSAAQERRDRWHQRFRTLDRVLDKDPPVRDGRTDEAKVPQGPCDECGEESHTRASAVHRRPLCLKHGISVID